MEENLAPESSERTFRPPQFHLRNVILVTTVAAAILGVSAPYFRVASPNQQRMIAACLTAAICAIIFHAVALLLEKSWLRVRAGETQIDLTRYSRRWATFPQVSCLTLGFAAFPLTLSVVGASWKQLAGSLRMDVNLVTIFGPSLIVFVATALAAAYMRILFNTTQLCQRGIIDREGFTAWEHFKSWTWQTPSVIELQNYYWARPHLISVPLKLRNQVESLLMDKVTTNSLQHRLTPKSST